MSKEIDEKVVSLEFDNKNFESNVKTSIRTIDDLKQSLEFKNSSKGFDNINTSLKSLDFSPLSNGIETAKAKFSALEVAGITAVMNLTNQAVNAGKRIAAEFTTVPIKTGFQEYETQINAVQTILANTSSKGTTLDQVNAALDELNHYADLTIYNFTEMTRNIGTFTAAGVDLDTSVSAIKGIANLAAVSGSTSQQASTAMYQLSQALAAGTVKLQDWNSVVNAGMGGQVFQDALKETAKVHGIAIDDMIKKEGSFRETLSKGWLTSDILTETLNKFTGDMSESQLKAIGYTDEQIAAIVKMGQTANDAATKVKTVSQLFDTLKEAAQSGWTQSWETIIGDYDEAKEFLTKVSDTFSDILNNSANARNEVLAGALNSNWKKLTEKINEAGVDTATFEEKLKGIITEHGFKVEDLIAQYGSLGNAFRDGAVSTDLLKEALNDVVGSVSKLDTVSRELKIKDVGDDVKEVQKALKDLNYDIGKTDVDGIIGTNTEAAIKAFQEANSLDVTGIVDDKTLSKLKELSSTTATLSDDVYSLADQITTLGGRELLIKALENAFDGLMGIITPVKEAFREIFPATTAEQLYSWIVKIEEFSEKLKVSEETANKIKTTFKGLFAILDIGRMFFSEIAGDAIKLLGNFTGLGGGILDLTSGFGSLLISIRDFIKENDIFGLSIGKVFDSIQLLLNLASTGISKLNPIKDRVKDIGGAIKESDLWGQRLHRILEYLTPIIDKLKEFKASLSEKFEAPGFEWLLTLMAGIWEIISIVGQKVAEVAKIIGNALVDAFRSGDFSSALDIVNGGLLATILLGIKKFVSGFKDASKLIDGAGDLLSGLKGILDGVKGTLEAWQRDIQAKTLLKIAGAIALLSASLIALSIINPEKMNMALTGISVLFGELVASMTVLNKFGSGGKKTGRSLTLMIGMAISLLILAQAVKSLSDLDWEELAKGLTGALGMMTIMVAALKVMSAGNKKIAKGATQLVIMAAALKIMASVCKDFSTIKWEELDVALSAIGGILIEFALFEAITQKIKINPKRFITSATAMVGIAASMVIFAKAAAAFGSMDWESLGKAGAAMGTIMLLAAGFEKLSSMSKRLLGSSTALVIIGAALEIFADVSSKFGSMDWESLGKAGAAVASVLTFAAGFALLSGMSKQLGKSALSLTVIGVALGIFAQVCSKFGSMDWESLGKAGAAIGGILALSAGFALLAGLSKNIMASAGALLTMSVALGLFVPVLKGLGSMEWEGIAVGLVAIAGAFAVIGIAGLLLEPIVPAILGLSGAVALLGVACVAIGGGVYLLATGLDILAVSAAAGATALVGALGVIVGGVAGLIPTIVSRLGEAVILFCQTISEAAPAIGNAIVSVLLATLDAAKQAIPEIVSSILLILTEVLSSLGEYVPQIAEILLQFVIDILNAVADKMPDLIRAVTNVISAFFKGIIDALSSMDMSVLEKGAIAVGLIAAIVMSLSALAGLIPSALISAAGMSLLAVEIGALLAAMGALYSIPGVDKLISDGGNLLGAIGTALGQFVGGIVGGVAAGATATLPTVATNLSEFMTNIDTFIQGAKQLDDNTVNGIKALADVILTLTGAGIIDSIASFIGGQSSLSKFAEELEPFGTALSNFSESVSGIDSEKISAAANAGKMLSEMAKIIPNSGGLSSIFSGSNDMDVFAEKMEAFGTAIVNFSNTVSGEGSIDTDAIQSAANAGKIMVELANTLPNAGGLISMLAGNNDIDDFGARLVSFGESIVSFSGVVSNGSVTESAIESAANACQIMINLAKTLPNSGGLIDFFAGQSSLDDFGSKLTSFGESMSEFSSIVSGGTIDEAAIESAASAGKALAEMAAAIPESGGLFSVFNGSNDMTTFGYQLVTFGDALCQFTNRISGLDADTLSDGIYQINRLITVLAAASAIDYSTVSNFSQTLQTIGTTGVTSFVSAFATAEADVKAAGSQMIENFVAGVKARLSLLIYTAKSSVMSCMYGLRSGYNEFRSAGEYVAKGFADGIAAKSYLATAKARLMASNAASAAKKELDIHSPSKVFYSIAAYAVQGFVNAFGDYSDRAYSAGQGVAVYATNGLRAALTNVGDIIDSDIDSSPTIRPVLDLSDVMSGVNRLDTMLEGNPVMNARLQSLSTSMSRRQNGSTNDDVVSAIRALGDSLNGSGGNTYNVNGITYDDGTSTSDAVKSLIRAIRVEGRV